MNKKSKKSKKSKKTNWLVWVIVLIACLAFAAGRGWDSIRLNDLLPQPEPDVEQSTYKTQKSPAKAKAKKKAAQKSAKTDAKKDAQTNGKSGNRTAAGISAEGLEIPLMAPSQPHQLLVRLAYTTSYNNQTCCPNWVGWHLIAEHTDGPYTRDGVPYYDEDLSAYGIGKITTKIHRNGFFVDREAVEPRQELDDWSEARGLTLDRGHMCPAGDNKWDKTAQNQSFLLTNMCPQTHKLNAGGWKTLEEKCRKWAQKYGDIYIVAGPLFDAEGGESLANGKLRIPDGFFKVVLCTSGEPKALGFLYRNDKSDQPMKDCVCQVDEVEKITGFDFFYSLPDEVENRIEASADLKEW